MDLLARLDRLPLCRPHYVVLVLCGVGLAFDATDVTLLAFSLDSVREVWGLSGGASGLIGSAGQLGVGIGAVVAGFLSDRWGRRSALMYWLIFYCVFTLVAALAPSYEVFLGARFLAGIGIGADAAILVCYMSEFFPKRRRGLMVGVGLSFFAFGAVAAALLGRFLIAPVENGWRWAHVIAAGAVLLVLLWRPLLAESPRYLLRRGRDGEATRVVEAFERAAERATGRPLPPVPEPTVAVAPANETTRPGARSELRLLLLGPMLRRTVVVLVLWIVFQAVSSGFNTWIPTLLIDRGLTVQKSFTYAIAIYAAQWPGYLVAAWLGERVDRKYAITLTLLGSAGAALMLSLAPNETVLVAGGVLLAFSVQAVTGAVYTYTPEQYPTTVRATATGIASGAGRLGSISAPLLIGLAVGSFGFLGIFGTMTGLLLLAVAVTLAWGPRTAGRGLEEIAAEGVGPTAATSREPERA